MLLGEEGAWLTFVVIARDHEEYLKECLTSVDAALPDASPLIVVDAGSLDRSAEVAESILETLERPTTFLRIEERDATSSQALWRADPHVHTPFVGLLSGDDALESDYFNELERALTSSPDSKVVNSPLKVCDGAMTWKDEVSRPRWTSISWIDRKLLFLGNPGRAPGSVVKWREFRCTRALSDNGDNLIEDFPLWLALSRPAKFTVLSRPVVRYRRHPASITGGSPTPMFARSLGSSAAVARLEAGGWIERGLSRLLKVRWLRRAGIAQRQDFIEGWDTRMRSASRSALDGATNGGSM